MTAISVIIGCIAAMYFYGRKALYSITSVRPKIGYIKKLARAG